MKAPLILASASERRRKILADLSGVSFTVVVPDVVEVFYGNDPLRTAGENSEKKNAWCRGLHPQSHIISADTIIDFRGRSVAKPSTMAEAVRYFELFSGKQQDVVTAVTLYSPGAPAATEIVRSAVTFRQLTADCISSYFSKVDPLDKAGGYDIDQYGESIIESSRGSVSNIMGLPRETIDRWLRE